MRKTSDVARLTALIKGKMSARRVIPAITKEVKDILLQEIVRHTKITKIQLVVVGRRARFPGLFCFGLYFHLRCTELIHTKSKKKCL